MPGLCVLFCPLRAVPSLEGVCETPPEVLAESERGGWERVALRVGDLSVTSSRMDSASPRFGEQVQAVSALVVQLGSRSQSTARSYEVLARVSRTRHVIGVSTEDEVGADQQEAVDGLLRSLAGSLNALVLRGTQLLDAELRVLLQPDGPGDPEAKIGNLESATARKARSLRTLHDSGVDEVPDLPTLPADEEAVLRSAKEVACRAQALWAVASRAAAVLERKEAIDLLQKRSLWSAATPEEQDYLLEGEPDEQMEAAFRNRQDALWTLLWALGHAPTLMPPSGQADLTECVRILRRIPGRVFVDEGKLRPLSELLDAADLTYRASGIVALGQRAGRSLPPSFSVAAVRERHSALFWLIGYMNLDWDAMVS